MCTEILAPVGQSPAYHHRIIIEHLQMVCDGKIDRLMILAPPGSAKSTYATVLFPAFWFANHPRSALISASHTGELAESFGRRVRNLIEEHHDMIGYNVSADARAAGNWTTDNNGVYLAAGVGQAIAGRRADLAIIDDPVKGREAADSQLERDKTWNWYRGDLYNRLKPSARVIVIQTRWHEDDLGGRLLQDMESGADQWTVLSLPAICDVLPDPLGRDLGEALWPEWEDQEALQRKKKVIGSREWAAQFQQRPAPEDGSIFDVSKIKEIGSIPDADLTITTELGYHPMARFGRMVVSRASKPLPPKTVRSWDISSTAKVGSRDPDWTVGARVTRTSEGRYVVEDVKRMRGEPSEVDAFIKAVAASDGTDVLITIPVDPGGAGKIAFAHHARMLAGYNVRGMPTTQAKTVRATPFASQTNAGNVSFIRDPAWNKIAKDELAVFPSGSHDDIVDALSDGFGVLLPPSPRERAQTAPAIANFALYRR